MARPFSSLLIANRGEIAIRVMRTAKRMGLRTIAVYSDADAHSAHVAAADEAQRIGPPPAAQSYLNIEAVIAAAKASGAEAIHPGYGFLSENANFAEACEAAGIVFVGPSAHAIRAMGRKDLAKDLMAKAGVPVVPGYGGEDQSVERLSRESARIGYPVLIKAVAGGGGKGMKRVEKPADLADALASAKREAQSAFGDDRVLIEKYVLRPRHIEMQIFGDLHGNLVHLFERDCSLQRRHQKVIEEAPAPGMSPAMRKAMSEAALSAGRAVSYTGAGTVEFIADASEGLRADRFWFMEMNTRLQVEHPVTETITGTDLVEWQLRVAAGEALPKRQDEIRINGHAIEARLYAEDPDHEFLPSVGTLEHLRLPDTAGEVRTDAGVRAGDAITPFYDPMIAKIIASGPSRKDAARNLGHAISLVQIAGVRTNAGLLVRALDNADFLHGDIDTGFIDSHRAQLLPHQDRVPPPLLARAAQFLLDERAGAHHGDDPWDAQDGFRMSGSAREVIEFATQGGKRAVSVMRLRNGVQFEIDGTASVPADDSAVVRLSSGALVVMQHGDSIVLPFFDPFIAADVDQGATDRLVAPLPGKVVQIFAQAGNRVKRGEPLVVLEAMKMEHTLAATGDLQIEAVDVTAGEQVAEGSVLIRFAEVEKAAQ